jgi:hypothetical protein
MDKPKKFSGDISKKIFEDFVVELSKRGLATKTLDRLRENYSLGQLTETDLKNSLLLDEIKS